MFEANRAAYSRFRSSSWIESWPGFCGLLGAPFEGGLTSPNKALSCASVLGGGLRCELAAALRLASSLSLRRVCTSSGESPPTRGLSCSAAAPGVPGFALAALVLLDENQSPTAPTRRAARKIHDCIRFGITPVAGVRLFVTGAAAVESSAVSDSGEDFVSTVMDIISLLASQSSSCACPARGSLYRQCGQSRTRHPGACNSPALAGRL